MSRRSLLAFPQQNTDFAFLNVLIASRDALLARKALLTCPDTAIVRCTPIPKDDGVKLEIRFPADQVDTVISRLLTFLPNGEIGSIVACATPRPKPSANHARVTQLPMSTGLRAKVLPFASHTA
jgi:hypothetical protein